MVSCDIELRDHQTVLQIEESLRDKTTFEFAENIPLLENITSSDLALCALKLALRKTINDADYQLPQFVMEGLVKGWTFLVTDHFAISIGVRSSERISPANFDTTHVSEPQVLPKIQPYPFDLFLGVVYAQDLEVQRYEVVEPQQAGDNLSIAYQSQRRLTTGDSMFLRAGVDVTVSHLQGTLVYMEITGRSTARVLPQFDPVSHALSGWISGDPMASRLELLTRVLVDFNYKGGTAEIMALTQHQDHYVRWNSIRHLLQLAPEVGLTRLREATGDAHPDVREVAEFTLARIGVV